MSAQLVLTDLEMEVIVKSIREARAIAETDREFWTESEELAADMVVEKLTAPLNRRSRRRPKT